MPGTATCELCGGPMRRDSKIGVCQRQPACKLEVHRRYLATNHEKIREKDRRRYAANREKMKEKALCYRAANREEINERRRRHWAANREKYREYSRRYLAANSEKRKKYAHRYLASNREKVNEHARRYYAANREKVREKNRRYLVANGEKIRAKRRHCWATKYKNMYAARRALAGRIPLDKRKGHLHPTWSGGMLMPCSVPGCHRWAGWRHPGAIKKNKTGFRCPVHRNVRLPQIKESDYEYQGLEALRSSVA